METASRKKTDRKHILQLSVVLLTLAVLAILLRLSVFGHEQLASGDRLWRLTVDIQSESQANITRILVHPPVETERLKVIERKIQHPGFKIRNWSEDEKNRRSILAYATRPGHLLLSAEFYIHYIAGSGQAQTKYKTPLTPPLQERYLGSDELLQIDHPVVQASLQRIREINPAQHEFVDALYKHLRTFTPRKQQGEINIPAILSRKRATPLELSMAMVALCRAAGIPARLVTGIVLKEDIEPQERHWVEVHQDEYWQSYDIAAGYHQRVPDNYLPLKRNSSDAVEIINGNLLKVEYELEREFNHPYLAQHQNTSPLNMLDLSRLPQENRYELALLMLLPLAVLITVICRHLAGLHSYGVFTPTLLALAMIYSSLLSTIVIFCVVCGLAVAGRSLFPASLSRMPRLAIIFTMVAILMAFSTSILSFYQPDQESRILLLPIVILTSVIDRLYRTIEDSGLTVAMHRLTWTLLITLLCLPVVQMESLGYLLLRFPEAHLITLAIILLLSAYRGKQLVNLPLIRFLAEPKKTRKIQKTIKQAE